MDTRVEKSATSVGDIMTSCLRSDVSSGDISGRQSSSGLMNKTSFVFQTLLFLFFFISRQHLRWLHHQSRTRSGTRPRVRTGTQCGCAIITIKGTLVGCKHLRVEQSG